MATKVVRINLVPRPGRDDDRLIHYDEPEHPVILSIDRGDEIEWVCDFPFAVHIGYGSPFQKNRYRGNGNVRARFRSNVEGQFPLRIKYSVAVCEPETGVWTDDPILIIER